MRAFLTSCCPDDYDYSLYLLVGSTAHHQIIALLGHRSLERFSGTILWHLNTLLRYLTWAINRKTRLDLVIIRLLAPVQAPQGFDAAKACCSFQPVEQRLAPISRQHC
jgi:hypothetical protein